VRRDSRSPCLRQPPADLIRASGAAPKDKATVYTQLGLKLAYDPALQVVAVVGTPDDPVGQSQCPRGDLAFTSTAVVLRAELVV
jgi:hypothetical protein